MDGLSPARLGRKDVASLLTGFLIFVAGQFDKGKKLISGQIPPKWHKNKCFNMFGVIQ
jgi:hypothetical protein